MCGGKGERMGMRDKGCVFFNGKPVALRVVESARRNGLVVVFAFVKGRTSCSASYAGEAGALLVETPGDGYVEDLRWIAKWAYDKLFWKRALILACDLPLISKSVVARILDQLPDSPWVSFLVEGEDLTKKGFNAGSGLLYSSVSAVDLSALLKARPTEEIPYSSVKYSPAEEVWDFDTQDDLRAFGALKFRTGSRHTKLGIFPLGPIFLGQFHY